MTVATHIEDETVVRSTLHRTIADRTAEYVPVTAGAASLSIAIEWRETLSAGRSNSVDPLRHEALYRLGIAPRHQGDLTTIEP